MQIPTQFPLPFASTRTSERSRRPTYDMSFGFRVLISLQERRCVKSRRSLFVDKQFLVSRNRRPIYKGTTIRRDGEIHSLWRRNNRGINQGASRLLINSWLLAESWTARSSKCLHLIPKPGNALLMWFGPLTRPVCASVTWLPVRVTACRVLPASFLAFGAHH